MSARIEVQVGADSSGLSGDLNKAKSKIKDFASDTGKSLQTASLSFKAIGSALAGAGIVASLSDITKQVFNTTAEFQKFSAVLTNTLGSTSIAQQTLRDIQYFAAKTPFSVQELTGSFVKLANQGFKPNAEQMAKLGDLASSTGKSFDMLAEAILDAQSGEFERLKEFGIRAKDAGDKVIFTFKGVQTTVSKTSESIRNYITDLGAAEGVSGSMAAISQTLGGKISNLGDNWDQLLLSVGGNTESVFSKAIGVIGSAIEKLTDYNKSLSLASKFNLKQDYGLNFQNGKLRFGDVAGEVSQVEAAQKTVDGYVKSIAELAKTPADFKAGMRGLASMAKEEIKSITDTNLAKAILAQYSAGVKTLMDLNNQAKKPQVADANFGTAKNKTKKLYRPEEIKYRATFDINGLRNEGIADTIKDIKRTEESFNSLGQTIKAVTFEVPKTLDRFTLSVQGILNEGLIASIGGIGEALGEALANGNNALEAAGSAMLGTLGGVLIQLGKLAIETGVGISAIKKALTTLNPVVAIAAGAALVALGAFVRGKAANIGGGGDNTSGVKGVAPRKIPGFATGVKNFSGGLAIVGERGPELVNLPKGSDVIANNRLGSMMSNNTVIVKGDLGIEMGKLVVAFKQEEALRGRRG